MRAVGRAEDVMRAADVRDPVAHGFVDGFLERLLAGMYGHDFCAEHLHAIDVEHLAFAIHCAHVDDAFQPEHRGNGRRGHAVLTRAGFGDDAGFAHAFREEDLPHRVVDLVRAGVVEVFALEINLRATEVFGQTFRKVKRCGTTDEFREIVGKFALKLGVVLRAEVFGLQFLQRMHQRLGHVTSAIRTEVALGIGQIFSSNSAHDLKSS
jgi:hypothetical protein